MPTYFETKLVSSAVLAMIFLQSNN